MHWKITEAPDHVLGLITQGVQVLGGVLLPSATVFLVLLCNDRPVLGPWTNTFRQNALAWVIVWSLVVLSLMLTAVTFFPGLSTATLEAGFALGAVIGLLGGAVVFAIGSYTDRRGAENTVPFGALDLEQVEELDKLANLTSTERKAFRDKVRATWRMPAFAALERPAMSPVRRAGLLTLRTYLLLAGVLVVVKVVQASMA